MLPQGDQEQRGTGLADVATLMARLMMASLFLMAGLESFLDIPAFSTRLQAEGLAPYLVGLVMYFLTGTGLALALGWQTRWVGLAMAVFSIASALMAYADLASHADLVNLLKNIALSGGYLHFAVQGAGRLSVDGWAGPGNRPAPAK